MFKKILFTGLALALLSPVPALAEFYAGASIGNTFVGHEVQDATDQIGKIDENSTGFKFFGGFTSDSFFGVEGGYRHLGKVDGITLDQTFSSQTTGWDVEGLGRIKLGPVDLFAKAGGFFWKTDTFVGNTPVNDNGLALIWGLGAGVRLGPVGIRLEWESMEVKRPDDLSMVSLGVTLGF